MTVHNGTPTQQDVTKPNIVYILADQHRHDALSGLGHPVVRTPNLDRLAAEGTLFESAWCQSPVCQPSRASIITGAHVAWHGISRNRVGDFDPNWPTFMRQLRAAGYDTANVGKTHFFWPRRPETERTIDLADEYGEFVAGFGFDHVVEEFDRYLHVMSQFATPYVRFLEEAGALERYRDAVRSVFRLTPHHWDGIVSPLPKELDLTSFLTEEAISWLHSRRAATAPFFLQLSYVAPHVPLMGDPDWSSYYDELEMPDRIAEPATAKTELWNRYLDRLRGHSNSHLLTDEYVAKGARQYYAMISLIDECVGRVRAALDETGQLERTWIIYSADHGEMLGDHQLMAKMNFYRPSVQVPAIIRVPPGTFTAQPRVVDLIEAVDITATVLDIAQAEPLSSCVGRSLLGAMRGEEASLRPYAVSEISSNVAGEVDFVAVTDGSVRATVERHSGVLCEVFDLVGDGDEIENLVGTAAAREVAEPLTAAFEAEGLAR